jgi:CDP-glucose 4,6-dehydratase
VARCANFYGGGDLNWNRIVPGTIRAILRGNRPVVRSDGSPVRDFFYVEDGVAAYMLLAEKVHEVKGEAFNFSSDNPSSVLEFVSTITRMMGSYIEPQILDDAPHEIQNQYLGSDKARDRLGWKPLFEQEEGLSKTIDWYRGFFR